MPTLVIGLAAVASPTGLVPVAPVRSDEAGE